MSVIAIDDALLRAWPLPVPGGGGKEERGRVLIVAGSEQIPGAAALSATAALRAGAGKVTIATPRAAVLQLAFAVPESRVIAMEDAPKALDEFVGKAAALLIGPGLDEGAATIELTAKLLEMFADVGTIVDAAAMDVVSKLSRFSQPVVLTPHCGEMAKLTGRDKESIEADCDSAAAEAAKRWNAVVTLKAAITHVSAPDGRVWRHEGGNAGLATSGSGDVLAGLMAGLVARGASLEQAAAWGVRLHAAAGERLAKRVGLLGYLARELSDEVPTIMDALSPPPDSAEKR